MIRGGDRQAEPVAATGVVMRWTVSGGGAGTSLTAPSRVRILVTNGPFGGQSDPSFRGMSVFACDPAAAAAA